MLNTASYPSHPGFTLVELLIALAIGSVVLTGLLGIFETTVKHSNATLNAVRLDQDLRTAMDMISGDIRRAGFWGNAKNNIGLGVNNNPFMTTTTDVTINNAGNCILLSYDKNGDGAIAALGAGDDERYGYRLSGQVLQARLPNAAFSCTSASTTWEDITNPKIITMTGLSFTKDEKSIDLDNSGAGVAALILRSITITLSGQLATDASVSKTLTQQIKIRNDRFAP